MADLLRQLQARVTADKRKLTVILVLALIGAVLWGRLLLSGGPDSASAESAAGSAIKALPQPPFDQPADVEGPDEPAVRVALPDQLPRDLFAGGPEPPAKANFSEKPDKSASDPADAIRAEAFNLQSVMQGSHPRAMINGQVVAEGERILGFALVKVAERQVVLRKGDREIRLDL